MLSLIAAFSNLLASKKNGFKDFWTIISKTGLEMNKLKQESQTTTEWFDVTQVLIREGKDWKTFANVLLARRNTVRQVEEKLAKSH